MDEIPITGYADCFSLTPGEKINFKVSSNSRDPYKAKFSVNNGISVVDVLYSPLQSTFEMAENMQIVA